MYLRAAHAEVNIALLQEFIKQNSLGILTTAIKSTIHPFIQSSHIPFILDVLESQNTNANSTEDGYETYGILRGHMAKQNPQAKVLMEALAAAQNERGDDTVRELPEEVLVLFNGPYHHYVTPKFYVETKPTTGKVVPTWNYSAVQAYGKIKVYCDSKSEETSSFLQRQVEALSRQAETSIMGYTGEDRPKAWQVSDAPSSYVDLLKKNIIGIEIQIHRLEGKFKMSQEMGKGDREGVIQGFNNLDSDVGRNMAKTVRERGDMKDGQT
jgi:transcriptional regulator